jgi:hypothetical protein
VTVIATPAGWYSDPTKRHEYRYWDGSQWTESVADAGVVGQDPVLEPAPVGSAAIGGAEPAAPGSVPAVPVVEPLPAAPSATRSAIAATPTFAVGMALVAVGVLVYLVVGTLSFVLGVQVTSRTSVSDTTFAIGTKGDPVFAVYAAGFLVPIAGLVVAFLFPSAYRLPREARAQWGGGTGSKWAPWARNYNSYLKQHLRTSRIYKSSLLGKLVAQTVMVVLLVVLAVANVADASSNDFTLQSVAYVLVGGAVLALVGEIVAWIAKRCRVQFDGAGRIVST